MADITQSDGDKLLVKFSANTTAADLWMRDIYGEHTVEMDREDALEFKDAAKAKGFTVESF